MTEEITLYPSSIDLSIEPKIYDTKEVWIRREELADGGYFRKVKAKLKVPELGIRASIKCEIHNIFNVGGLYVDNNGKKWTAISPHELLYTPQSVNAEFKFPRTVRLIYKPFRERCLQ